MNTTPFIPEPLFVIDSTSIANEGPRKGRLVGTFDIMNRPTLEDGRKWIGDTKPYGDGFPDIEEAKAYAKLFAASPDMLNMLFACKEFIKTHMHYPGEGMIDKIQQVIDKATN